MTADFGLPFPRGLSSRNKPRLLGLREPTCCREAAPASSWLLCLLSQRGQSSHLLPHWTQWSIMSGSLGGLNMGEKEPTRIGEGENTLTCVFLTPSAPPDSLQHPASPLIQQLKCSHTKSLTEVLLCQLTNHNLNSGCWTQGNISACEHGCI